MYRHILVTLDGSRGAEAVLPHAAALARSMRATLTIMRVVDPVVSEWGERGTVGRANGASGMQSVFTDQAEHYLQGAASKLRTDGIIVNAVVRQGQPAKQIVDVARDIDADAIAMATRSRRGLNRLMFGSVAEEVLHRSQLPVLLVRQD